MIYQNIKSIADSKGISIRRIEQDVGIVLGSIYHWNDVKPSVDKVAKVAKYLGVTVEELLGNDSQRRKEKCKLPNDFLKKDGKISIINDDGETVSLKDATQILALASYKDCVELSQTDSYEEKNRLERKVIVQSTLLNAMSRALSATKD